ncbi:MAG: phosphoglucosamine mutase [Thermoguttaceae bacterium]|nr:phosphoglucosamine mutase [Thermoguttaceae bacterium]MDW8038068.1 phosphoglucosamine mutase [Thermoguttaceae bacterium]
MGNLIISVSGLRGVVGQGLTPEVALRYVAAFTRLAPAGRIVVARDSRPTGLMLLEAVLATLHAAGRNTLEAGIIPTPTLGVLVRKYQAAGGIMISASHNPPEYNGIKLFAPEGRVVPQSFGQQLLEAYRRGQWDWAPWYRIGSSQPCPDPIAPHLEAVLAVVDAQQIRSRSLKVLLDANHGAGAEAGRRLLEALGCQAVIVGGEPDGQFEHPPEPTAENLASLSALVRQAGVDLAFAMDPDADRLAILDSSGRYLGEEATLALCVDHVLKTRQGPIVTNCATSRMIEDLARKYDVPFFRSPVGEPHVVDLMLAKDALFGGEGNGGPIDPRVGYVRDCLVGMALVLEAMAQSGLSVAGLADQLPRYEMVKTKVPLDPAKVREALDRLERHFSDARADRLDGLRLDWPDRWLLVRPSNTEPICRIIAEARTEIDARTLTQQAAQMLTSLL